MNGWMRLWIFLTAIWSVVVIGIGTIVIVDTYNKVEGPWIAYSLSEKAKPFFQNLEPGKKGPVYIVEFSYSDGTKQRVRLPLLEGSDLNELDEKIKKLGQKEGKEITEKEIRRFLDAVFDKNSEAKSALAEYQSEVDRRAKSQISERRQAIGITMLVLIIPPVVILILGYGIAWVRRGFA